MNLRAHSHLVGLLVVVGAGVWSACSSSSSPPATETGSASGGGSSSGFEASPTGGSGSSSSSGVGAGSSSGSATAGIPTATAGSSSSGAGQSSGASVTPPENDDSGTGSVTGGSSSGTGPVGGIQQQLGRERPGAHGGRGARVERRGRRCQRRRAPRMYDPGDGELHAGRAAVPGQLLRQGRKRRQRGQRRMPRARRLVDGRERRQRSRVRLDYGDCPRLVLPGDADPLPLPSCDGGHCPGRSRFLFEVRNHASVRRNASHVLSDCDVAVLAQRAVRHPNAPSRRNLADDALRDATLQLKTRSWTRPAHLTNRP